MEVSGRKVAGNLSKYFFLGSEEDLQLFCVPCDRDGPRVTAYGYCKDCDEHLCETCYKGHKKPTPCRKHVLLGKNDMPQTPSKKLALSDSIFTLRNKTQKVAPTQNDQAEKCHLHQGKLVEYFCCDHKFLGCGPCIMINHRYCNVNYIPEVFKNYKTNPDYIYFKQSLINLKDNCKRMSEDSNTQKIKLQKNQTALQNGVRKFRHEINMMLDKWETDISLQSDSIFAEENAKTDSVVSASNKLLKDIQELIDSFKTLEKEKKNNAIHVQIKTKTGLVKQYKAIIKQMQEKTTDNHYTFELNLAIQKMLKLVTNFGKINIQTKSGSQSQSSLHKDYLKKLHNRIFKNKRRRLQPIAEEINEDNNANDIIDVVDLEQILTEDSSEDKIEPTIQETVCVSSAVKTQSEEVEKHTGGAYAYERLEAIPAGDLYVRIPTDKIRCRNKAIAIVDRDQIAVADSENLAIKLIDTKQEKAIYDREVSSRPNGVTIVPDQLLAVALPEESKILFLSIPDRLSEMYHLKVEGRCTDLSYLDGKLVVTYQNPGKVEIMDLEGHIFRLIQQNMHGASLYDDSRVTTSTDNSHFFISDRFFKNVKCFDKNGKLKGEYNDKHLIRPCGVVALDDGSLLVCNSSSHSIHLVSPNLREDRVLLKKADGIKHPWSIATDKEQSKLYVTSVDTSDHISVYDLKFAM
jgi:hypothetical protein